MSLVWQHSKAKGTDLLLLLAISDNADDDGVAFPGITTLAKKTRMSNRNVMHLVQQLEKSGELSRQRKAGPHGVNIYTVMPGGCQVKDLARDKSSTCKGQHVEDAKSSTRKVKDLAQEPSVNHQEPPQGAKPRPRDELFDAIAEVCQVDPNTAGGSVAKVKQALMKANPPYSVAEVKAFGEWWWGWKARTTPPDLWKLRERIGIVRQPKGNPNGANAGPRIPDGV